ncbi:MAG: YHS domain-containing protein, partial [Rhodospirillales bacterium]|nr:YHS domain-containing protein [Rhodospirillales bacterium]
MLNRAAIYRLLIIGDQGMSEHVGHHGHHHHHPHHDASTAATKDPVCGMTVDPATAKHRYDHQDRAYYFCCGGCLEKFKADPDAYLKPALKPQHRLKPSAQAPAPAGAKYTCPMHPEIVRDGPGDC